MTELDFDLSEEQRAAVQSEHPQLTLIAGAGSGKTRVLVAAYLKAIVENGITPDRILAVTFTKKAAAEMKKRIVQALRDLGRNQDAQIAETGPIQTFHGFCDRMLRENSLAAGIDPEFTIADESSMSECFEYALGVSLERQSSLHHEVRDLIGRLAFRSKWGKPQELHARISEDISSLLDTLQTAGWSLEDLQNYYGSTEKVLETWVSRLVLSQPSSVGDLIGNPQGLPAFNAVERARRQLSLPPLFRSGQRVTEQQIELAAEETFALTALACDVWAVQSAELDRRQEFGFTEMERRAVRLLRTHPEVRAKLLRQYALIMVDEAQDLNPVQYQLLDALSGNRTFLIGDPQQSIYRFRHADRTLLVKRSSEVPMLTLTKNYRSRPSILSFIDEFFHQVWPDEYRSMVTEDAPTETHYDGVEIWQIKNDDSVQVAQWIAELVREGNEIRDIAVLSRTHAASQQVSSALLRHGIKSRIIGKTERFYTRLEIRDLANALRALTVPNDRVALLAMLLSPIVGLSLDAVVLLTDELDILAALPEFKSPIEADQERITELLRWYVPLAAYADRIPAWEVYSELLARTDFLPTLLKRPLGNQMVANVRKLLVLATQQPKISAHEYADHLRNVQAIQHKEAEAPVLDDDGDAVTLMTLHSAKGLEFPVVVLNNLVTFADQSKIPSLLVNPGLGMVVASYSDAKPPFSHWLKSVSDAREQEEEMRLLYVGMTRAMQRLCIVNHDESRGTIQSAVAKAFIVDGVPAPGLKVRTPDLGER